MAGGRAVHIFDEEGSFSGPGRRSTVWVVRRRDPRRHRQHPDRFGGSCLSIDHRPRERRRGGRRPDQRPVQFPATAPYIKDNRLTGTPPGSSARFSTSPSTSRETSTSPTPAKNEVDRFFVDRGVRPLLPGPACEPGQPRPRTASRSTRPTGRTDHGRELQRRNEEGGVVDTTARAIGSGGSQPTASRWLLPRRNPGVDSSGRLYQPSSNRVDIFDPAPPPFLSSSTER